MPRREARSSYDYDDWGRPRWGEDGVIYSDRDGRIHAREPRTPPPPPQPSEEEVRTYHSSNYRSNPVRIGMRFDDLDGVVQALEVYGGRIEAPLARAAEENGVDGMGVALAMQGDLMIQTGGFGGGTDKFVDRLTATLRRSMADKGRYYDSWDWEGPGPFCKTIVQVEALDDGGFLLRISRQSDPEPGLARKMNAPQAFYRVEHAIAWKVERNRFAIPLDTIGQIARIYGATEFDAEAICAGLLKPRYDGDTYRCGDSSPVTLFENDDFRLSMDFINFRVPAFYELARIAQEEGGEFDRNGDGPDEYRPRFEMIDGQPFVTGRAKPDHRWEPHVSAGVEVTAYAKNHFDVDAEQRILAHAAVVDGLFAGWLKPF